MTISYSKYKATEKLNEKFINDETFRKLFEEDFQISFELIQKSPTLIGMINTFKGKYNYVPGYKGAYYKAGSNSITMGDGYTNILALAHELGHATGTYQNGVALEGDNNLLPSEKFALIYQQAEAEAMFYEYLVSKELAVNAKTIFEFGEKGISVWKDNVDEANKDINGNKIDPKNEKQKVVDLFDNVLKSSSYNNNREEFDFSNVFKEVGKLNEDMIPSGQVEYPELTYNESKKYTFYLHENRNYKNHI